MSADPTADAVDIDTPQAAPYPRTREEAQSRTEDQPADGQTDTAAPASGNAAPQPVPPAEGNPPAQPARPDGLEAHDRDTPMGGGDRDEQAPPCPGTVNLSSVDDPLGRGRGWPPGLPVAPQTQATWQARQQAADTVMTQLTPGAIHLHDANEQAAGTDSWKDFLVSMVWGCILPDTRTWCRRLFETHEAQDDVISGLCSFWDHQGLPGITPRGEGI